MKIRAWLFITFWALTSITFLHLGFHALENTELSNSVSPVIMFMFKHSLAVSSCFSSSYALKFRAQSKPGVRSNWLLLVYVFFAFVFPRTVEGKLIWHVLKLIFSWLLFLLLKLKIFFAMILRFPASAFRYVFVYLWKILAVIGVIIVCLLLYQIPPSLIISIIYTVGGVIFLSLLAFLNEVILGYIFSWIFMKMEFIFIPLLTFIGACSIIFGTVYCLGLFSFFVYKFILSCKKNFSEPVTRAAILLTLEISLFFVTAKKRDFSPIIVLTISHFISVFWASLSRFGAYTLISEDHPSWEGAGLFHIAVNFVTLKMNEVLRRLKDHKAKKFIEFAVGTVGAILFQNFFRITSFSEVAAFLYLAVMWLANLVLMDFCADFGVFNFLLANVVVGCTVGQFGLHSATWISLGAALLLFALRLKLESVAMAYEEDQQIEISVFGEEDSAAPPHNLPI